MEEMQFEQTKNGRRKWKKEQKMQIVKELESGIHHSEICRKYNISDQMLYRWKKRFESRGEKGLKHKSEIISKSYYIAALKKIEELERALGRKSLEVDVLKKSLEMKGLKLPDEI